MKKILLFTMIIGVVSLISGCQSTGDPVMITQSLAYDNVEEIFINVSSADVEIIEDKRNDIYVEFSTYENGLKLRTSEGKTTLIETYDYKQINVVTNGGYKLKVYVPEGYKENMKFDLSSGSIDLSEFSLNNIDCDLSSGDIKFENVSAKEIQLDLSSGDVDFYYVETELLDVDVSSGEVLLGSFKGKITGNLTSGDFHVSYKDSMDDLNLEGTSGSIDVDYREVPVNGVFDLTKSSGDIDLKVQLDNYKSTDDGDRVTGEIGSGEYNIRIDVTSGDITIK